MATLKVERSSARRSLMNQLDRGRELAADIELVETQTELDAIKRRFKLWDDYTDELIRTLFEGREITKEYAGGYGVGTTIGGPFTSSRFALAVPRVRQRIQKRNDALESIIGRIELFDAPISANPVDSAPKRGQTVFVVHGRSDGPKQEIARFLETLDLQVKILEEQPYQGSTTIEKLDTHGRDPETGFAVVILSPEDEGRLKTDEEFENRARQNVIFEMGYFFGHLGRENCAVILTDGLVEPSDITGLGYIPYPDSDWKLRLAKELNAAGIAVDMNKLAK